jgi:hypothetical protein
VDFVRRLLLRGYAILPAGPTAEIDHLAALAAEWPERVWGEGDFLVACGTFHGRWGDEITDPSPGALPFSLREKVPRRGG